jgi:hypothetical protein
MKDWLPGNDLRVCWNFREGLEARTAINCQRCEKCARTIVALAVGGVDPGSCGFSITADTVKFLREFLASGKMPGSHLALWWAPMQQEIPENIEGEMFGLREFLQWFRTFDLGNVEHAPRPMPPVSWLYHHVPLGVSETVRSIFYSGMGKTRA